MERTGELVSAAVTGVETLDEYITQFLPARLLAVLVPGMVFLVALLLDPWTLVLLFAGPMMLLLLACVLVAVFSELGTGRRFLGPLFISEFGQCRAPTSGQSRSP
jgi:ABC-type transport system involved in cytochrome bd biosynthesis fused ATPase/permease subunit